jgi:GlcNAc-P-P-Und epimerase
VRGRRILVTGGSGFIGTNLVEHLLGTGAEVTNVDCAAPRDRTHLASWARADLQDRAALHEVVARAQPELVVHLAARTDLDGATLDDYRPNTDGVANVVAAALAAGSVRRVVFGSSQLVCTPGHVPSHDRDFSPPNAYGESKVIGEEIVRAEADGAFEWVLVRPTSIWGPWFGQLYSAFFRAVQAGRYLHPRGIRIRKSFGYVGNAVHQLGCLLEAPPDEVHGRVLYLADYEPYPIFEWAQMIAEALGAPRVREVPVAVLRGLALGGDGLQRLGMAHPPLTSYRLRNMLTETVFDLEPLRRICGPLPWALEEGTRRTARWLLDHQGGEGDGGGGSRMWPDETLR